MKQYTNKNSTSLEYNHSIDIRIKNKGPDI